MPTINIKELDKTTAVESAVDTNVVYVPGFSAKVVDKLLKHTEKDASGKEVTIPDAIIFDESGLGVEVNTVTPYGQEGQKAYNTADKRIWRCVSGKTSQKMFTEAGILPEKINYKELSSAGAVEISDSLLPYLFTKRTEGGQDYYDSVDKYVQGTTYYLATVDKYTFNQSIEIPGGFYKDSSKPTWITREVQGTLIKQAGNEFAIDKLTVVSGTIASLAEKDTDVPMNLNTSTAFNNLYSGTIAFNEEPNDKGNYTVTLAGDIKPGSDSETAYFVINSNIASTLTYQVSGTAWEELNETEYDIPSFNEAVEFTATTKEQDFVDTFGDTPYIFPEAQAYPVNGKNAFSASAYASGNNVIVDKGSPDKSYIYARELLNAGLSVVYEAVVELVEDDSLAGYPTGAKIVKRPDVAYLYRRFIGADGKDDIFNSLTDKGTYNIKFITSGGYPTFEYGIGNAAATVMNNAAVDRGDVAVLIDPTDYPGRTLCPSDRGSVYNVANNSADYSLLPLAGPTSDKGGAYAAMVPVWIKYTSPTYGQMISMPGSFAYLISYANSVKTYADWLAIAGVARGIIPNCQGVNSFHVLTNSIAEAYQAKTGISINPITYIRGYGYALWGNRTLLNNNGLTASSFLNLRSLVCDVKKTVYAACRRYMFEQNNDVLWVSFKSAITPTLEKMVAGYGIESYKIVKLPTREKAKIVAEIILTPIYAVEDFEVTIVLTDSELTVE